MGLDDGELDLAKASLRGRVENMFDSFDDNHIKEQHTLETIKEGLQNSIKDDQHTQFTHARQPWATATVMGAGGEKRSKKYDVAGKDARTENNSKNTSVKKKYTKKNERVNVVLTPLKNYQPTSYKSTSLLVFEDTSQTPENETNAFDDFGPFNFEPDADQEITRAKHKKKVTRSKKISKRVRPVDIFNTNAERQGNMEIVRKPNGIAGTPPTPLRVRS